MGKREVSGNSNRRVKECIESYGPFALLLGFAFLYGYLMRPGIAGLWYDDGVYLLGSKALATGQGYRLLSEPGLPAIVKYPPLLSLLLAPLWWLGAGGSGNWFWFKAFNLLVAVGSLGVLHHFARRYAGLGAWAAGLLLLLVGLTPTWLSVVTDVMSEPLYLLLTLTLLLLGTRIHQRGTPPTPREKLAGILLSVAVFYTRSIGITIILGLAIWLWRRFGAKLGAAYLVICGLLGTPWWIWTAQQPSGIYAIHHVEVVPYNLTYFRELSLEIGKAHGLGDILWNNLTTLPAHLIELLLPGLPRLENIPLLQPMLALFLLIGFGLLGIRQYQRSSNDHNSPIKAYVLCYLLACLLWYANDQVPRLLLPILPFIWIAILQWGNHRIKERIPSAIGQRAIQSFGAVGILLACLQSWNIAQIPRGDAMAGNAGPELWQDYQATFAAIRRFSTPQAIFWARHCSLFPLYTQRLVISRNLVPIPEADRSGELPNEPQDGPQTIGRIFSPIFSHEQVRYLILEPDIQGRQLLNPVDSPTLNLILALPSHFSPVYRSPHGYITVYRYTP